MQLYAPCLAQEISLNSNGATLEQVIKVVEKQSGLLFFYKKADIEDAPKVSMSFANIPFRKALNLILSETNLYYELFDNTVVIRREQPTPSQTAMPLKLKTLQVSIQDQHRSPLPKASIRALDKPHLSFVADERGQVEIPIKLTNEVFTVSHIAYKSVDFVAQEQSSPLIIILNQNKHALEDITVSTGLTLRHKESFTGSMYTRSDSDLKQVGTSNLIESLKAYAPAFIVRENTLMGANPNTLPQIEVRGKTSVPGQNLYDHFGIDPNQPIFILNGFETNLRNVMDLDLNRILNVSILKDASSSAIYGARASNGVIVIETKRPTAGPLLLTFQQEFTFEVADLSVYNMMNAAEKLVFDQQASRYTYLDLAAKVELDALYNKHLEAVKRGVDTYWLKQPLHDVGFSHKSSLYAEGGNQTLSYGAHVYFNMNDGVMKGAYHQPWSASLDLAYKKKKLFINNEFKSMGYKAAESPYGNFAKWVNTSPLFALNNKDRFLEESRNAQNLPTVILNPTYDALLQSYEHTSMLAFQNNLYIKYVITPYLSSFTGIQLRQQSYLQETFKDPQSNAFLALSPAFKGTFYGLQQNNNLINVNSMLSYDRKIKDIQQLTGNLRFETTHQKTASFLTQAEGFAEGSAGSLQDAFTVIKRAKPLAGNNIFRTLNMLISVNYAYDNRYLMDFSYRKEGSTAFGSKNQYAPFWSTGIGWNVHKESFLRANAWLNKLKITYNLGKMGNQNFGSISSFSVYNQHAEVNGFGESISLMSMGYPNLKPQSTIQHNLGIDFGFFDNRLQGWINIYQKNTDPLVILGKLPASSGIPSSPQNAGSLQIKGLEGRLDFLVKQTASKEFTWRMSATGNHYVDQYAHLQGALEISNLVHAENNSLMRYFDGASSTDLWALQSMGIDPSSGRELFLTTDGKYSFDAQRAVLTTVGNSNPKFESVISQSLSYKNISLAVFVRWRRGAAIFNTALYNKVENISYASILNNQDKRALANRWEKAGDQASFLPIQQSNQQAAPSSRFIQTEHSLTGESLSFSYHFTEQRWLKTMKIRSLTLTGYCHNFFRITTVLRERGLQYPFTRSASLSIQASF